APALLAGLGIERGELAAPATVAAGNAGIDHAVVVERRAHDRIAILPAADERLPDERPGFGIERHESTVETSKKHFVLGHRDATIGPAAADCRDVLIDAGAMLPDQDAGPRIKREDVVVAGREIHHAAFDDGRAFHRVFCPNAGAEIDHPGGFE